MAWTTAKKATVIGMGAVLAIMAVICIYGKTEKRHRYQYQVPEKTDDGWEVSDLRAEKLNTALIDELFERINDETFTNLHSILLVRNNKLVLEQYFPGMEPILGDTLEQEPDWVGKYQEFDHDTLNTQQSATKSISSILIGIAIDQRLIRGVDEKISTFFPEFKVKDNIRLKHFLSMTAGLKWNEHEVPYTDPNNDCERMNRTNDPVRFLLERPSVTPPGTKFAYNGAISVTLGEIIRKVSGMSVDKFAQTNLFNPLGISNVMWKATFLNGAIHTSGGLYLRPRDMAKIGCMMLNGGQWQGKQIVSKAWVAQSIKKQAPDEEYGFQWWLRSFKVGNETVDSFLASGYGGQVIVVVPTLQLVFVSTGWNPDKAGQLVDMMQRYIFAAAL